MSPYSTLAISQPSACWPLALCQPLSAQDTFVRCSFRPTKCTRDTSFGLAKSAFRCSMQHGCVRWCVRRARSYLCYAPFCKTATCRKSATDRVADLSRVHCTISHIECPFLGEGGLVQFIYGDAHSCKMKNLQMVPNWIPYFCYSRTCVTEWTFEPDVWLLITGCVTVLLNRIGLDTWVVFIPEGGV